MRSLRSIAFACSLVTFVAFALAGCGSDSSGESTQPKSCDYTSTYDAIQETIFEAKSCTAGLCHGAGDNGEGLEGGLDLREGASFDALVRQPSQIDPSIDRVHPGDQDLSLLYLKLEAATNGTDLGNLGGQMPVGIEPLSEDQLEAIRLWIRGGAPRDTIVGDTLELLGCEGSYDPDPNKIAPLPAPAEGEGVQLYAGAWELSAESEDEVCFATYYDFSDQVPPESQVDCPELGEGRKCFTFRRNELAQDGQSHHSIIDAYLPESDPNGGDWGPWQCLGGAMNGQACDPTVAGVCGERAQCATPAVTAVACLGYSHAPAGFGVGGGGMTQTSMPLGGAQESVAIDDPPVGVYSVLPLKGFISWNSHAFNLTKKDTTIEQWINLTFAPEPERQWIRRQIFEARNIFAMGPIDPFEKEEICMTWTLPQYAQLLSLSSHMHQRGKLFRIWLPPNTSCGTGVAGCEPPGRDPDYASRFYDDPVYTYYVPPNDYSSADQADRTFLACAVFDNGADNPLEVKRESTKPNTPACDSFRASCGCDASQRACLGGDSQGMLCAGDDAACGGGGMCDACPLLGGVTTDDEMFLPLGSYYVAEP